MTEFAHVERRRSSRSLSWFAMGLAFLGGCDPTNGDQGSETGVTSIAAGNSHTCAVVNGGAWCWGRNDYGQLGDASAVQYRQGPVPVSGLESGVMAIAAGNDHTCAVVNGGVRCWGRNDDGQLGNGTNTNSNVPVPVSGLSSGMNAVAAGTSHTCAVRVFRPSTPNVSPGFFVECWGSNIDGQLGDGTTTDSNVPVRAISNINPVTAIAAGVNHTCAVVNGGARCWGGNGHGQLGDPSAALFETAPVQVSGLSQDVTAVAGGEFYSCAVVNGGVWCWGNNLYGKLGDGTSTASSVPVQVSGLSSGATVASTGPWHACAVVNGGVQCWGRNNIGQLGGGAGSESDVPVQVSGLSSPVTAVAAGTYHTCAVVNGGAWCWGMNLWGQLGDNSTTNSAVPVAVMALWNSQP